MKASVVINDIYDITGIGAVPVGQVKTGVFKVGMRACIGGKIVSVKTIEVNHKMLSQADSGMNIGFQLRDASIDLLKKVKGKEVRFSDEEIPVTVVPPDPIHPEGAFGFLKNLFKRE